MRIRRLTDPNRPVPGGEPLLLAPQTETPLEGGRTLRVVLDLAVRVEPGAALLVVPLPVLLEVGVLAAPVLVAASDPLTPLTLPVYPLAAVTLRAGVPIARGVVLDAPIERFYEDEGLDAAMAGPELRFETGRPAAPAFGFGGDEEKR